MKYLIIIILTLSGCSPRTIYVDKVKKINTCPVVEGVDLSRPEVFLLKGGKCDLRNITALVKTIANLKQYSEGLELENKRLNKAIKACKRKEK